ncbi:hypothetical protein HKD37_08G021486 [Glycine soja]
MSLDSVSVALTLWLVLFKEDQSEGKQKVSAIPYFMVLEVYPTGTLGTRGHGHSTDEEERKMIWNNCYSRKRCNLPWRGLHNNVEQTEIEGVSLTKAIAYSIWK